MKEVNDALILLGLLERGTFKHRLSKELTELIKTLREQGTRKKSVKGSLTVKLDIDLEDGQATLRGEITTKAPKEPGSKTILFTTKDGGFSQDHPEQTSIMDRLEAVGEKKETVAA